MYKRIICVLLCMILFVSGLPMTAEAEEYTYYQIKIDAGDGVQYEKAIIENDEIYIPAESFSKYTRFDFAEEEQSFVVKDQDISKAFKKVKINAETKLAAVGTKTVELENSFVIDGEPYLPFCQMLPILNADMIDIDSGIIYVVNNKLSMAELLYDFDVNDYFFNISEEFFDNNATAYWYVAPSFLFDTVTHFRFDRLDIIFESGRCADYQAIMEGYIKDNELYYEAMSEYDYTEELLNSITGLNSATEKLDNVYDWFDSIEEIDYESLKSDKLVEFIQKTMGDEKYTDDLREYVGAVHEDVEIGTDKLGLKVSVADVIEAVTFVYNCKNMIEDHPKMLDAVYGITEHQKKLEEIPGASSTFTAVDPEYLAAEHIYKIYYEQIEAAMAEKFIQKILNDITINKTFDIYKGTAALTGEILEIFLPGDSGDRALLPYHSQIANSSLRKCAVPTLETEKSTNDYRLSLLLELKASKACYEIMAETAEGYGEHAGYYRRKINEIENLIKGLYLVAENVAFDTYENYEKFQEENRRNLKASNLLEMIEKYETKLFDESYWVWTKGTTNGTNYAALFHKDGTIEYCRTTNMDYFITEYEYYDGVLTIDEITYEWDGEAFVSHETFEVMGNGMEAHFKLRPDVEGQWSSCIQEIVSAIRKVEKEFQEAQKIDKKLVQIKESRNDGERYFDFTYDEEGKLVHIERRDYGSYYDENDLSNYTYTLSYNDNNKLIENKGHINTVWGDYYNFVQNTYDSNGMLKESINTVDDEGGYYVEYEPNTNILMKTWKEFGDTYYYQCFYAYDLFDKSINMKKNGYWYADVTGDEYDSYGGSETYKFTYEYKPFVIYELRADETQMKYGYISLLDEYGNGNSYLLGEMLFQKSFHEPEYFADEDGYLKKIVSLGTIYEFFYDK